MGFTRWAEILLLVLYLLHYYIGYEIDKKAQFVKIHLSQQTNASITVNRSELTRCIAVNV